MNTSPDHLTEIDECSCVDESPSRLSRKHSFNQKTRKILSNLSWIGQSIVQSTTRHKKPDSTKEKRPQSMYVLDQSDDSISLDQYMHDSTLLMALREMENKLTESETARSRMESKIDELEKEIYDLQSHNDQSLVKERSLIHRIQELERNYQSKEAEAQEYALNARIREMELMSEIATLTHRLTSIDTERQERKIQKIMECQNRIMEQTLPYTASVENIYDNEDGLFNAELFGEIMKEHGESLDQMARKLSSPRTDDEDHFIRDSLINIGE